MIETCTNDRVVKINASEITITQITEVFGLMFDEGKQWRLVEDIMVGVPSMLSMSQ